MLEAGTPADLDRPRQGRGFGEGFPASQAHLRCALYPCPAVSSPPATALFPISWQHELPSELSPAADAPLSPYVVSPSSLLEVLPSASIQPGSPPFELIHAHIFQCTYGMSKFLIS